MDREQEQAIAYETGWLTAYLGDEHPTFTDPDEAAAVLLGRANYLSDQAAEERGDTADTTIRYNMATVLGQRATYGSLS